VFNERDQIRDADGCALLRTCDDCLGLGEGMPLMMKIVGGYTLLANQ
jgi:hypothetical protein